MKQDKTRRDKKTRAPFRLNKAHQILQTHLPELREHYGVHALWIFGSHARGEPYRKSDLDLLVECEMPLSFFEFIRLERHLREKLRQRRSKQYLIEE